MFSGTPIIMTDDHGRRDDRLQFCSSAGDRNGRPRLLRRLQSDGLLFQPGETVSVGELIKPSIASVRSRIECHCRTHSGCEGTAKRAPAYAAPSSSVLSRVAPFKTRWSHRCRLRSTIGTCLSIRLWACVEKRSSRLSNNITSAPLQLLRVAP